MQTTEIKNEVFERFKKKLIKEFQLVKEPEAPAYMVTFYCATRFAEEHFKEDPMRAMVEALKHMHALQKQGIEESIKRLEELYEEFKAELYAGMH